MVAWRWLSSPKTDGSRTLQGLQPLRVDPWEEGRSCQNQEEDSTGKRHLLAEESDSREPARRRYRDTELSLPGIDELRIREPRPSRTDEYGISVGKGHPERRNGGIREWGSRWPAAKGRSPVRVGGIPSDGMGESGNRVAAGLPQKAEVRPVWVGGIQR